MRRHRSCFLLAAGAGLLLAFPLGLQAQTPQELKAYERRLQQLFEQLDRDGNRRLERQEVQGQPYLQRHFDRLDQNRRGYLTPADLKPSNKVPPPRAERVLRKADQNGDGSLDRGELNTLSKPAHAN
jgi:Ca2+-binding EF-hand superfamily protein